MTMQHAMPSEQQAKTQLLVRLFLSIGVLPILLVVALVLFSFLSENFFTFNNIANVLRQTSYLTIVALGHFYVANLHTLSTIFRADLGEAAALAAREAHCIDVVRGYLRP